MLIRIFTGCLLVLMYAPVSGQLCFPVKKTFAYFQPVTPGNAAKTSARTQARSGNYYLYIESRREGISVPDVWVNGKHFRGAIEKVESPVLLPSTRINPAVTDKDINRVLVPPTKRVVYQVMFMADSTDIAQPLVGKFENSPLVFRVKYRKKTRLIDGRNFVSLDPVGLF